MPRNPWTTHQCGFKTLRVPSHSQPVNEEECVVYSLWMVASYVGNEHPNPAIRTATNVPTIDDIHKYIETGNTGWIPNQDDLTELSTFISTIHCSLESWQGDPPKSLMELSEKSLKASLPMIAIIDAQQLRRGIRGSGPLHAVVIVGCDNQNSDVAIADPWYANIHTVDEDKLEDAWDPMLHQIIDVDVARKGTSDSGTNYEH